MYNEELPDEVTKKKVKQHTWLTLNRIFENRKKKDSHAVRCEESRKGSSWRRSNSNALKASVNDFFLSKRFKEITLACLFLRIKYYLSIESLFLTFLPMFRFASHHLRPLCTLHVRFNAGHSHDSHTKCARKKL